MSERSGLLASVAETIKDYREGELPQPTPDHVDRWVCQFEDSVQVPILREVDHVLKRTYFTQENVDGFFANQIKSRRIAGDKPCDFWQAAHLLDIQKNGNSQSEILSHFISLLRDQCDPNISVVGQHGGSFVYIDDVIFSGSRIRTDLASWIKEHATKYATLHIIVIASHNSGLYYTKRYLNNISNECEKHIDIHIWTGRNIENGNNRRNVSEVLWPAEIPDDARSYVEGETDYPFQPRQPIKGRRHSIFSSEEGRQLLERELLLAGLRIRSFCKNPKSIMRPLGFSLFGLGFGSTIVTYRNCPNNAPLALWWGDPDASPYHPFSKWYPLVPRKTYNKEGDFEDYV